MVVDEVARRLGAPLAPSGAPTWRIKDEARQLHLAAHGVVLVEPLSFMNESGRPVRKIASWWKTPPESILVISDDLDLPLGRLRMRAKGGSGGHNGLKSIVEHLGGEDFPRLRIGIGRGRDAIDYVLAPFSKTDVAVVEPALDVAADGVVRWLSGDVTDAIQLVNSWGKPENNNPPEG